MKIYTRTGDGGETGLFGGGRVRKDHLRVEAFGEIDELNAAIGLVVAALDASDRTRTAFRLLQIQHDLFAIGAHLATPGTVGENAAAAPLPPLPAERIGVMEGWMDEAEGILPPLREFVIPGGTESAARLHVARTVCRRVERRVLTLTASTPIEGSILVYLNRLSDLLFTFARMMNADEGRADVTWVQAGGGAARKSARPPSPSNQ